MIGQDIPTSSRRLHNFFDAQLAKIIFQMKGTSIFDDDRMIKKMSFCHR